MPHKDPVRRKAYDRARSNSPVALARLRQRRTGWSGLAYMDAYRNQDGKCAICGTQAKLEADHDHARGLRRALLCHPCNSGLGLFRDDPHLLRQAAGYLEEHAARELDHEALPLWDVRKEA